MLNSIGERTGPCGTPFFILLSLLRCPSLVCITTLQFDNISMVKPAIGLYRDVWIAAIASSTTSLATRTAAICVRFQGRRVRRVYVTMQNTFLTRKSALIYRRGLRQRVASLTLNGNGVFAIRAYVAVRDVPKHASGGAHGAKRYHMLLPSPESLPPLSRCAESCLRCIVLVVLPGTQLIYHGGSRTGFRGSCMWIHHRYLFT